MTSAEAVQRAKSHNWREISPTTEQCASCLLVLSKSTDLELVPACEGRLAVRR